MAKAKRAAVNVSEAVAWAAYNYEKIVTEDHRGHRTLSWEQAETEPPSDLAKSYLKFAANNPSQFFSRTVPHFLGEDSAQDEERAVQDRKTVMQLKTILRKYIEADNEAKKNKGKKVSAAKAARQLSGVPVLQAGDMPEDDPHQES